MRLSCGSDPFFGRIRSGEPLRAAAGSAVRSSPVHVPSARVFPAAAGVVGVSLAEARQRRDVGARHHPAGADLLRAGPGRAVHSSRRLQLRGPSAVHPGARQHRAGLQHAHADADSHAVRVHGVRIAARIDA